MSNQDRSRQPKGITIGGQFATEPKQEAAVDLTAVHASPLEAAAQLGAAHDGDVDLDNGEPFDIYDLFEKVTGRDYDPSEHPQDELDILEIAQAFERSADRRWGDAAVEVGSRSPWGEVDFARSVAPGIVEVSTASHGGVKLSPERNRAVPAPLRNSDGWYEEDCEAAIVAWAFAEAHCEDQDGTVDAGEHPDDWSDPDAVRERAAATVRNWFPDQWEEATGETVTAEQSTVRAEQEFYAQHANDHVTVSAAFSDEHPGMVVVTTTIGGRRPGLDQEWQDMGQRTFLVPREEYNGARGGNPFVVDPARHTDITAPMAPKQDLPRVRVARVERAGLTSVQSARVDKDLGTLYRCPDGSVKALRDIIETDGVTGKGAWVDDNGRTHYQLQQKRHADSSSYTSFEVAKATFDALVDVPDARTDLDLAREDLHRAKAALAKVEKTRTMGRAAAQERAKKVEEARRAYTAAQERLRELAS